MEENNTNYTDGFNKGYLLSKHRPELLKSILPTLKPENNFLEGLISGSKEHELEQNKTHLQDLNQLRNKSKSRENDREL
ncbi:MAG: hypothetical protein RJA07_2380 [Bacteroidota bacterium]|jgi:hypothetical protein